MRVLLQRVTHGQVHVDAQVVGAISQGLVILLGVGQGDTAGDADKLAEKVANPRIFSDAQGKFNLSLLDVAGGALVVSQFTLYADARKGRAPSFTDAAPPDLAKIFATTLPGNYATWGVKQVETGIFAAHMLVTIHNDGPVTLWLDSREM